MSVKSLQHAKLKIKTNNKSYPIKDSSLYNLTPHRLQKGLGLSIDELEKLTLDDNYRVFMQGNREIQFPKYKLNRVHTRLASLLCRIEMPDYLHSGVKKRSYITNAKAHLGNHPVLTMDISLFFKSISKPSIYNIFKEQFNSSPDVAGLLASLCSYKYHLPTGSRISLPLSYWCSNKMYSRLQNYCINKKIKMTAYVDDITFSGDSLSKLSIKHIENIISDSGYKVNKDKTRFYPKDKPKMITGVILNGDNIKVRNKHQKRIHELLIEMPTSTNDEHLEEMQTELLGRLDAAGQVEQRFSSVARSIRKKPGS